eukprot:Unigene11003_Nuclearia_a/m.33619 Unigene11003_Nuclearia_a/g.33619  ORF Unigene11003_Nuclearia_a/g.33619 Unigene11003_Nuclearia_a/m.33619 type:complete len:176 (-) Unigene11003_Nuclearia_a:52-579(-)
MMDETLTHGGPLEHNLFSVANLIAIGAWFFLWFAPAGYEHLVPIVLSSVLLNALLYVYALATSLSLGAAVPAQPNDEPAGFSTLGGVLAIFRRGNARGVLAAWIHYLCFDLLAGLLIARDAHAIGLAFLPRFALLAGAMLYGPAGWLAYALTRYYVAPDHSVFLGSGVFNATASA